jgi:hypothetical protein
MINNDIEFKKERLEAAIKGYSKKNYDLMLDFLQKWFGHNELMTFLRYSKVEKRAFCARLVYFNAEDEKLKNKANKMKGKTSVWY